MLHWDDPVAFVPGATATVRRAWMGLGLETVGDLLETVPRRYDDYSKIVPIGQVLPEEIVTVRGTIVSCKRIPSFRQRFQMIRATMRDETGTITATFFNQEWLLNELTPGRDVFFSGKVKVDPRYGKSLAHPLWEPATQDTIAAGKFAPVYSLSGTLVQKTYRRLIQGALEQVDPQTEILPGDLRARHGLPDLLWAARAVHLPKNVEEAERGRQRLAFDELFAYQLALQQMQKNALASGAPAIPFDPIFAKRFVEHLSFPLTNDQKRVAWVALQEMERARPMRRLLQGDVGCGKTIVAAFLAAHVQRAGYSAAILAPTDILARQHAISLRTIFGAHHIPLVLVTRTDKREIFDGHETPLAKEDLAQRIEQGKAVFVGTHALLSAHRLPADLGLAVIDEQHRFGVEQREILSTPPRADGRMPHLLSMTATPIPRSLALSWYGDLSLSIIKEKPKGRLPILTHLCVGEKREQAYQAIREAVAREEQAFVVCPLIDPSDALGVRSATHECERLRRQELSGLRLGLIHGRLKPDEKETVMKDLLEKRLDVLVATSVIEVGIDVPRATVILIEGAERFGLAQLHQLRGRVGRSPLQSFCYLLTDAGGPILDRLRLVEQTQDGLKLAEADLRLRGTGRLIGTEQSGHQRFRAAQWSDFSLMAAAQKEAKALLARDPFLETNLLWRQRVGKIRETTHGE